MTDLLLDVRYAWRMLRRSPGFTAVAVITLALGIGANTAIFSLIDAVMLRPIPARDPQQLVLLQWHARHEPKYRGYGQFGDCESAGDGTYGCAFSWSFFEELQQKNDVFSGVVAFGGAGELEVSGDGPASTARGQFVSGDYFHTMGVPAFVGRTLAPGDDSPSAAPSVMLSYGYWQRAFAGQPSAVGRTIRLNNVAFTIVGVGGPEFPSLTPGHSPAFWIPLSHAGRLNLPWVSLDSRNWWLVVVGRLKPGVSREQAASAVSLQFRNHVLYAAEPLVAAEDAPFIRALPAQTALIGQRSALKTPLYTLMMAVSIVLLIACANIAGLLLAKSAARRKEIAVRLALGGTRLRIARQLLTESVLISVCGGAAGVLFAWWGVQAMVSLVMRTPDQPFGFQVTLDLRLLAFTAAISIFTGLLFGLAPALRSTRVDLTASIKQSAAGSGATQYSRGRWFNAGNVLAVVQVSLAIVVLAGAGLLVRTLHNLRSVDPGFDTRNVLLFGINPKISGYKDAQSRQFYRDLRQRLGGLPGVISASYSSFPLAAGDQWTRDIHLEGQPAPSRVPTDVVPAGPGFFETMRIPLLAGRFFNDTDFVQAAAAADAAKANALADTAPIPVLINQTFARTLFAGRNPIGLRFRVPDPKPGEADDDPGRKHHVWEVVGVAGDVKYSTLRRPIRATMYEPITGGGAHFEIRTAGDPKALIAAVRSIVAGFDAKLAVFGVSTQTEVIAEGLAQERAIASISSFFGGLALLLACLGVYGLLSYEVTQRTREIGIRTALGAQRHDILRLVVGRGLVLGVVGTLAGAVIAFDITRYFKTLLYGVKPADPVTFAGVAALLILVVLAACYIPARRAAKVDPMVALRYE